jgi:hypothetical protein
MVGRTALEESYPKCLRYVILLKFQFPRFSCPEIFCGMLINTHLYYYEACILRLARFLFDVAHPLYIR